MPDGLDLLDVRRLEPLAEPLDGELRHPLLEEAEAEHAAALDGAGRVLARELELPDRFVGQAHFLVGDPEVEVRLVVLGRELLLDALLELAEDLLERDLALGPVISEVVGRRLVARVLLELLGEIEELLLVGEEVLLVDGAAPPGRVSAPRLSPARCISSSSREPSSS